jgi:arginine deiminase
MLVGAVWLGYRWGSADVARLKAELAEIARVADAAQQEHQRASKALEQRMSEQAAAHDVKVTALNQQADTDRQALDQSLKHADVRQTELTQQLRQTSQALDKVRAHLNDGSGSAEDRANAVAREAELIDLRDKLAKAQAAQACLKTPVPSETLTVLNRSAQP